MKEERAVKTEEVRAKIRGFVQQAMQEALEGELEEFLGYARHQQSATENSRNGHSRKTVSTDSGQVEIEVPRDRKSEFEPKLNTQTTDSA